jgi:YbgC/YbaW family acyl-CoA thioester hydrolase
MQRHTIERKKAVSVSQYLLKRRVQFYETDAAGIVHFSQFFRYMEEAEHALWRSAGLSIAPAEAEIGWPRVAASFEYRRPLRFEDEFEIWLGIAEIGERNIRYVCRITRGDTRIANGSLTIACVTKGSQGNMKSTVIPAAVAARFEVASESETD